MSCPHRDCQYRQRARKGWISNCGYFLETGRLRGCPADTSCVHYTKKRKRKAASSTAILKAAQPKLFQLHYSSIKGDLSI